MNEEMLPMRWSIRAEGRPTRDADGNKRNDAAEKLRAATEAWIGRHRMKLPSRDAVAIRRTCESVMLLLDRDSSRHVKVEISGHGPHKIRVSIDAPYELVDAADLVLA